MRVMSTLKKIIESKEYAGIVLFIFSVGLYLPTNLSTQVLLIGCLLLVPHFRFTSSYQSLFFSTFLLFLLVVIGQTYTNFPQLAFKELEHKVMFGALPLLIYLTTDFWQKHIQLFKRVYTATTLVVCAYLLLRFLNLAYFSESPHAPFSYYHTYHNYSRGVQFHATYLSLFVSLALFFLIEEFNKRNPNLITITLTSLAALLIWTILLSMSRAVILMFILLAIIYCFKKLKAWVAASVLGLGILGVVLFATTTKNNFIFDRFERVFTRELAISNSSRNHNDPKFPSRFERWECAFNAIQSAPIFGYGAGSEKTILGTEYELAGLYDIKEAGYDAHNQFISIVLTYGLLGLIVLVFQIGATFSFFIKKDNRDWSLFLVLIMIILSGLTENILNRQKGIVLYALCSSLILFVGQKHKIIKGQPGPPDKL